MSEPTLSNNFNIAVDTDLLTNGCAFGNKASPVSNNLYLSALDQCSLAVQSGDKLGIYLHLPFCPSRCLSCDRHAEVSHDVQVIERYLDGLELELAMTAERFDGKQVLAQLHIGGGTPNYLTSAQLARVGAMIDRFFIVEDDTDTSIECSPKRTTRFQLELLRGLGFKNICFEVREFDPLIQSAMGRTYSPELLQDACENARAAGFECVTIDLVYGLPDQRVSTMQDTLGHIVDLAPDRIHCQPFVRRSEMFPHQQLLDTQSMPSVAEKMSMFVAILHALEAADYHWVGVHGFAREGDPLMEAQQEGLLFKNYLGYTAKRIPWVIGFGIGAVSELPGLLTQNQIDIESWQQKIHAGLNPKWAGLKLAQPELEERTVLSHLCANLKVPKVAVAESVVSTGLLHRLQGEGLLEADNDSLTLTDAGRVAMLQYVDTNLVDRRWISGAA